MAVVDLESPMTESRRTMRPHTSLHQPRPVFIFSSPTRQALQRCAVIVIDRVHAIRRQEVVGSYLFVNAHLQAFVLSENKPAAVLWLREHIDWLVAMYDPNDLRRIPRLPLTVTGVIEDLTEHLADLRRKGLIP